MEGESKVNDFLKKDFNIRIISIVFAIFLWFFVLDSSANPFETKILSIPVKILNETSLQDKGLGIRNKELSASVNVTVRGRKDKINNITAYDFEAYVDFSKIKDAGNKELKVDILSNKDGISVESKKPQSIMVNVEKIIKNPIQINIIPKGTLKENYKIIKAVSDPVSVEVEGVESLVKEVATANAEVNVEGLNKSQVARVECKLLNKSGDEVTGFGKNFNVDVTIEVAKEVPVTPVVVGKPAKDFINKGSSVNPGKVLITGLPDVIDKLDGINTETVNIDNLNKNIEVVSLLKLPDGVKLVNSSKEVKVSVSVEQLVRKDFTLSKGDIGLINNDASFKYAIITDPINVGIKGRQKDLDSLNIASLKPTVDVSRLTEGTYKLPLKFTLTSDLTVAEEKTVEVEISKNDIAASGNVR